MFARHQLHLNNRKPIKWQYVGVFTSFIPCTYKRNGGKSSLENDVLNSANALCVIRPQGSYKVTTFVKTLKYKRVRGLKFSFLRIQMPKVHKESAIVIQSAELSILKVSSNQVISLRKSNKSTANQI